MEEQPQEYRLLLLELIYEVTKVSRFYRGRILHSPIYIEAPGWSRLCQAAEITGEHARRILAAGNDGRPKHRSLDLELPPPPPITDRLAEAMNARRAARRDAIDARRPRFH